MKKQQVLYEIFLKNEFAAAASILYSVAASFSKNTSTPIYKMVNTLSVDSHLKALKLTSMLHPSIFLQDPQGLYLCPEYLFNVYLPV